MDAVFGYREIIKLAERGEIEKIIIAKNCPREIRAKLESTGVKTEDFPGDERDLAVKFGKPFPVSSVGIRK